VGTSEVHNLTNGSVLELRNPATRTVGFSPDGSLVTLWSRVPDAVKGSVVDAGWAVPTMGGALRPYLKGVSELDWSPDGRRMVYHPPAEGDPLFVTAADEKVGRQIYVARPGVHNHFPVWSHDGAFIYFVQGLPLDESDVWRIRPTGGEPERITFHNSRVTFPTLLGSRTLLYLATDDDGSGPWIYAMDVERRVAHRISMGVEEYMSLAASANGRRMVATVSRSTASLWRVPIADFVIDESGASRLSLPTARGLSPRAGRNFIVYRAPKAGTDAIVKVAAGTSTELWNGVEGRPLGGAAIAPDGQRVAFLVQKRGLTRLYLMNADGTGARRLAEDLDMRGAPAWSPDGKWLAIAANRDGSPQLFKIPVSGGTPILLVNAYSVDPIWSPSGQFLVYSGADVGTNFSVNAVSADGMPRDFPTLILTRGARRLAFLGGDDALVMLKGDISHKEFWLVNLETGRERQLTNLGREFAIGDFDVSVDGREIIFDRAREESDIVVFALPGR
jgi:Tol biopolymer transport system component